MATRSTVSWFDSAEGHKGNHIVTPSPGANSTLCRIDAYIAVAEIPFDLTNTSTVGPASGNVGIQHGASGYTPLDILVNIADIGWWITAQYLADGAPVAWAPQTATAPVVDRWVWRYTWTGAHFFPTAQDWYLSWDSTTTVNDWQSQGFARFVFW